MKKFGLLFKVLIFIIIFSNLYITIPLANEKEPYKILIISPSIKSNVEGLLISSLVSCINTKTNVDIIDCSVGYNNLDFTSTLKEVDLVICLDDIFLTSIIQDNKQEFSNIPIIAGLKNPIDLPLPNNISGFYMEYDFSNYMDYLLYLHPNLNKVSIVADSNFYKTYIGKQVLNYANSSSIIFNLIKTGVDIDVAPIIAEDNAEVTIVFDDLLYTSGNGLPSEGTPHSTIRAISKLTQKEIYGGYSDFITRYNIGGYNYDTSILVNAISNYALSILDGNEETNSLGLTKLSFDNPFVINTRILSNYLIPKNLDKITYIDVGSGQTLIEQQSDHTKNIILFLSLLILMVVLLAYFIIRFRLKRKDEQELSKNTYITNLSHELRTPLNVIISTIQLLDMYIKSGDIEIKNPNVTNKIEYLKCNSQRLLKLINSIIDITKIDAGFYTLNAKKDNIISVIEDITLTTSTYAENKNIDLIFDTNEEEFFCIFDKDIIERTVLNLVSNALKYTPPGGLIKVLLTISNDTITVDIIDNGIGIAEKELKYIFDRFKQSEINEECRSKGSGIGLSLVKSLLSLHNGSISVTSVEGQGSTFTLQIPIVK